MLVGEPILNGHGHQPQLRVPPCAREGPVRRPGHPSATMEQQDRRRAIIACRLGRREHIQLEWRAFDFAVGVSHGVPAGRRPARKGAPARYRPQHRRHQPCDPAAHRLASSGNNSSYLDSLRGRGRRRGDRSHDWPARPAMSNTTLVSSRAAQRIRSAVRHSAVSRLRKDNERAHASGIQSSNGQYRRAAKALRRPRPPATKSLILPRPAPHAVGSRNDLALPLMTQRLPSRHQEDAPTLDLQAVPHAPVRPTGADGTPGSCHPALQRESGTSPLGNIHLPRAFAAQSARKAICHTGAAVPVRERSVFATHAGVGTIAMTALEQRRADEDLVNRIVRPPTQRT